MKKSWQNIYVHVWQNIYEEVLTKHIRWSFDKAYTMKPWQNIYVHIWQNIYDEIMTKHIRSLRWRSHDKAYTMKPWQSIYAQYDEEVLTKHLRSCLTKHIRRNHENSWGEKRGEISPLHLKYIFGSFTLITMKKSWQNIYDEIMTKHLCYTVMLVMNVCPKCWR